MVKVETTDRDTQGAEIPSTLDEIARAGARRMLIAALEAEVADYIERFAGERDERGHRRVVRNGKARPRKVTLGCGTVEIKAPRVNDRRVKDGERQRFQSRILPPYLRKSENVAELLPVLYLRGLSTGDFDEALRVLVGADATAGLSASSITRLTNAWTEEYRRFQARDLSEVDYVYVWVDGVHFNVRLDDDRLCVLVVIGVRPDGTKELVAIEDGYRESRESWASLLRGLGRRGMRAPRLAIGDGALGFWAAVRDVWPETRAQRDWVHKLRNVLDKLPKRLQAKAKAHLKEIMHAESRAVAEKEAGRFAEEYGAKYPKAVECLTGNRETLFTFFDFPAEHWVHIRTTNPVESAFATVRLRQKVTKGAGSRIKGLTMAFKLLLLAERSWRRLNGYQLLPLVRAGATFVDGVHVERIDTFEKQHEEDAERRVAA